MSTDSLVSSPSATSFVGLLFGLIAFSDISALGSGEAARRHWDIQAPSRLAFFMGLSAYTYIFKPRWNNRFEDMSIQEERIAGVKTGLVFTWAFFELVTWFWVCYFISGVLRIFLLKFSYVGLYPPSGREERCTVEIGTGDGGEGAPRAGKASVKVAVEILSVELHVMKALA